MRVIPWWHLKPDLQPMFAGFENDGLGFFFALSGDFDKFVDGQVGQVVPGVDA